MNSETSKCVCQYTFINGESMQWQRDRFSAMHRAPLSCKSTTANNQQVHDGRKSFFAFEREVNTALCSGIRLLLLPTPLFFFSLFPSLCIVSAAADGGDGMGWIFNRFVSGSTMGGGIVVNIITYRSLRLHFPRPCHAGAITHSRQPLSRYTCLLLAAACDSACPRTLFAMLIS